MQDLRREIVSRMKKTIHGKQLDMFRYDVELPHMVGVTPVGETHFTPNEDGTILDPRHEFWESYYTTVTTERSVRDEMEAAIRSLKADGTLKITWPYTEEAEIAYVEVNDVPELRGISQTECVECEANIDTELDVVRKHNQYYIQTTIDCPECEFSGVYVSRMQRL